MALVPLDGPTARALVSQMTAQMANAIEVPAVFSPDECRRIVALREVLGHDRAKVEPPDTPGAERTVDVQVRDTERTTLLATPEHAWMYARLGRLVEAVNARVWQFDLTHAEPLQLLTYREGGHYGWHADLGTRGVMALRKLSVTVQLSDATDYEGGQLELEAGSRTLAPARTVGSAVVFPAWQRHRVAPVTAGVRHALVVWVTGRTPLR